MTNGLLMNESIARAMVEHRMHSIVVSIDASCPKTYEHIRIGGNWDVLVHNLETLQRVKRELGSVLPYLELAFVMMRSNIKELPAVIGIAKELGVSAV